MGGSLSEIKVDDMVAVEANGGRPFWLAKVLEVIVDADG